VRLAKTHGLKPNGEPLGDGRSCYKYDANALVLTFSEFSEIDVPSHISELAYECDERENWIERRELGAYRGDSQWR
jgi:hypothetical protein